jgi:transcriptional regulator with XRE-family HTH domain
MVTIPTIDMVKTGQHITELRVQAGLSVRQLQDIFGFSTPQALYKWQHGTALPTIDNLVVLAAVLGVKVDDILVMNDSTITVNAMAVSAYRVVSRRIIETNRHGIFTRDMEAIHIFHIPRLFRPVEV